MLKRIKFTKDMFQKLVVGIFGLILFFELTYGFGFMITALFLGDYNKAQEVTYSYSLFYKIILTILTGALIGTFFIISRIFYSIGISLFGKDKL